VEVEVSRGIAVIRRARTLVALACVLPVLALVLLSLNDDYQRGLVRSTAQSEGAVTLDVALVNEDRGVDADDGPVNLGRSYVKQVESDSTSSWDVLSRGVAERGLASGAYHLVVIIPAEFSAKLLDLDSADPAAIGVTYQVNGKGNSRVEVLASQRGREIVTDLNGQLVDMYVASILGNLQQAQDGVRVVAESEARHVQTFTDEVDPATRALGSSLGTLSTSTGGSFGVNEDLVASLDVLGLDQGSSADELARHELSLAELLAARAAGAVTHGTLLQVLLAMDSRALSHDVDVLARDLSASGASLEQQLDAHDVAPDHTAPNHAAAVAALSVSVSDVRATTAARVSALRGLDQAAVLASYPTGVLAALGWDAADGVTLAQLVALAEGLVTSGTPDPRQATGFEDLLVATAADQISRLPYRTSADLAAAMPVFEHGGDDLAALGDSLPDYVDAIQGWDRAAIPSTPAEERVGHDLTTLAAELDAARSRVPGSTTEPPATEPPATPRPEPSATPAPTVTPAPSPSPSPSDATAHPPVDTGDALDDLVRVAGDYGARVAQVVEAYRRAADVVAALDTCAQQCGLHPGTEVADAVGAVIWQSVRQQLAAEDAHLATATGLTATLEGAAEEVRRTTAQLHGTVRELSTHIAGQLDELARMRASLSEALEAERSAARSVAASDARTQVVVAEARTLTASSEALAVSSLAQVERARQVTDLLDGLRGEVAGLLDDSAALDARSARLVTALAGQTDLSSDLATAFGGVLPNAYSAGVLNERLMRFLVEPVAPAEREPVASADVTRPFSWVLIAGALSLAAGIVLARSRSRAPARESALYSRRDDDWVRINVRGLGTTALVGVVVGAGLAWASAQDLDVPREAQLLWGSAMLLVGATLTLLVRWLVAQLRALGVGIAVVMVVGYVFLSDAVGSGASSGAARALAAISPLSRAESLLTGLLGVEGTGPRVLGWLVVALVLAAIANLLVVDDLRRLLPGRRGEAVA
jgi:type VII secretion EsaA-like protein